MNDCEAKLQNNKSIDSENNFLHKELNRVKNKFIQVIQAISNAEAQITLRFSEILKINASLMKENSYFRKGLEVYIPGQKSFGCWFNLQAKAPPEISHKRVRSCINQCKSSQNTTSKVVTNSNHNQIKILETIKSNLDELLDLRPQTEVKTTSDNSESSDCVFSLYKEFELSQNGSALKSKSSKLKDDNSNS